MSQRSALGGAVSLTLGTVAFALFSPATAGCSTTVVVLSGAAVTTRGCAAYSFASRVGIGLMAVGAVLLLGTFLLIATDRADRVAPPESSAETAVGAPEPPAIPAEPSPPLPADLPPGWYGNPNSPDGAVQWWDGSRLTDAPGRPGQ